MKKIQLILNIVFATVIVVGIVYVIIPKQKSAYITTADVFEKFTLKQELEKKYQSVEQKRTYILDSIKLHLNYVYGQIQKETNKNKQEELIVSYQTIERQYKLQEQQFAEENAKLSETYNNQIFAQINQYVKDYGKIHGYLYIYGTTGEGNIMYADDICDITPQVIEYINNRYDGK